ncbi:hypothetical protein SprV_0301332400 [Sparganum proliferum]
MNTTRTVEIPHYDGTESITVWLRRAKFYLREVAEVHRPWTLLKALAPKQLDKALDAGLDADLPFDVLCQRLANLFNQTYSCGDAIEQLHQRRLKQGETPNQLVQDLERLTTAAFPSLGSEDKENIVLHYFIKALPSSELSRSLVLQPPGDLRNAIDRAERYIRMDSATEGHPEHAYRQHGRRPDLAPVKGRYPLRPGRTSPNYNQYNQQGRPFRGPGGRPPYRNQACTCSHTPSTLSIISCNDLHDKATPFYARLLVNNQEVNALIDTGATVSLVNPRIVPQQLYAIRRPRCPFTRLTAADGSPMNHIGTVSLDVTLPQSTSSHTFIVTPKLTWDLVLGIDFLARHGCQIDVKQRTVRFSTKKEEEPMTPAMVFDDAAICAAIQTSVQIPPTSVSDILSKAGGTDRDRQALEALLLDFEDVFAWDEYSLGRTNRIRHSIETGSAKPIWQPPRRIPVQYQNEVRDLLDNMLATGVIRPSHSPWASPVTLVPKKDGKLRFCIDYRRLNAVTTRDSFPLPRIECTLDALAGSQWFSTLDLKSGYWQVEVEPTDRQKTAFILPQGLFEFETMPFGLCNAAATFQRLMQVVLAHLYPQQCLVYLDDVIVFGRTIAQHNQNLYAVLEALREAGLRLNPQKCQFLRHQVSYLGHEVSAAGIRVAPEKIDAIRSWPTPQTPTEVRGFIGLASYYRRFIANFAGIARPLHRLTEKGRRFLWSEECQTAFDGLKARLTTAPILRLPNVSADAPPFILDTDASAFAIGAVLSQADDSGQEKPLCFASKTLSKPQRNYCTYRRELLAIITFIKQFRPYLLGRPFVVRSDHKALQWLQNTKDAEGQLARWQEILQEYKFTCIYRSGKQHANADALSRRPPNTEIKEDNTPEDEVNAVYVSEPTRHHWAVAQSTDPDTAVVYDHLSRGQHRPTDTELRGSSEAAYILRNQWPQLRETNVRALAADHSNSPIAENVKSRWRG